MVEVPAGGGAAIAIDPLVDGAKLSYPVTLALDTAGDLFIADLFANRVVEIAANGGATTAIDPSVNGQSLHFPYGVAVDAAGDLFIADADNRMVQVPAGGGPATAITPTVNGVAIDDPIGIGLDAAGDLFIADSLNNRVVEVERGQPPAINFAATAAGTVSSDSPQSVTIQNVGNAPLTIPVPATGANPPSPRTSRSMAAQPRHAPRDSRRSAARNACLQAQPAFCRSAFSLRRRGRSTARCR